MAEDQRRPNVPAIKKLMRENGYDTAEQFARATKGDISERSIQLILTGKHKHKESTLQIIADALEVSLEEIILPDEPSEIGDEQQGGSIGTMVDTTLGVLSLKANPAMSEEDARNLGLAIKLLLSLRSTRQIRILPETGQP